MTSLKLSQVVNVTLSESGNVIYYGDPMVTTVIAWFGNVTKSD